MSVRRSLSAAEQLSKAGYGTIAWVNGGLDTAKKTDLPVKGADDLRYGGIGGISEALGWTDVQREKSAGFMGGSFGPIKVVSTSFDCPPAELHLCVRMIILPEISCYMGVPRRWSFIGGAFGVGQELLQYHDSGLMRS